MTTSFSGAVRLPPVSPAVIGVRSTLSRNRVEFKFATLARSQISRANGYPTAGSDSK